MALLLYKRIFKARIVSLCKACEAELLIRADSAELMPIAQRGSARMRVWPITYTYNSSCSLDRQAIKQVTSSV